ncbi:TspO/MBR related protein [Rhodothalassium salexigens DSM 2132]|uniref:TspO/MBR related protein n=1 Tax=Rhodothalassium salexigens DSM 2132 TaxID=1188247 RepID=A0A4V2SPX9_RHOSA|nr:TspO/MBR family protein [Rhodothalassium salexigens]MBB4210926.1 tryptophan-rich sensory protein [Rhodothalassium salexigens DSM 2132]MBK1639469.1 hypothetical protein [Rhodothalassium salexigens DSM 2132]TCP36416.1 TspO/MBR related protein [Rhodothalassium salexigens DSM 2132]
MAIKQENRGYLSWAIIVGLTMIAGFSPTLFGITEAGDWYNSLPKPPGTPKPLIFPIAWTLIFLLIGWGAWFVHRTVTRSIRHRREALELYGAHLVVNAAWPIVFFGLQMVGIALLVLIALIAIVGVLISRFWYIRPIAGMLLLPYMAWLCFAFYLNMGIWLSL